MSEALDAALDYAARGWRVFPLHGVVAGRCACGRDCGRSAGKHPRTARGFKDATVNAEKIETWWARTPAANVGLATGQISGIWVLDVDPRHGGDESLAALEAEHGALPDTAEVLTGGGGRHLYWRWPADGDVPSRAAAGGPGLDTRGTGGYVVAPPSIHGETLRRYEWEVAAHPVAEAPDWLLRIVIRAVPTREVATATPAPAAGARREPGHLLDALPAVLGRDHWVAPLLRGSDDGVRYDAATRIIGLLLHLEIDLDVIEAEMTAWCGRCRPPASVQKVLSGVRSLSLVHAAQKASESTLTAPGAANPLAWDVADEAATVPADGGVDRGSVMAMISAAVGVQIADVLITTGDPPRIVLRFDEGGEVVLGMAEVLAAGRFSIRLAEGCRDPGRPHTPAKWRPIATAILRVARDQDAGDEATEIGETLGWVAAFIEHAHKDAAPATAGAPGIDGKVVVADGMIWFRVRDLYVQLIALGVCRDSGRVLAQRVARAGGRFDRRWSAERRRRTRAVGVPLDTIIDTLGYNPYDAPVDAEE